MASIVDLNALDHLQFYEGCTELGIEHLVKPLKEEFLNSCEKFADTGNETGVWKV